MDDVRCKESNKGLQSRARQAESSQGHQELSSVEKCLNRFTEFSVHLRGAVSRPGKTQMQKTRGRDIGALQQEKGGLNRECKACTHGEELTSF